MSREEIIVELAGAKNLAGHRFFGLDLENIDFSDADLTGAFFSRCRFAGARFDNVKAARARFDRTAGLAAPAVAALERAGAVVERPGFCVPPALGWIAIALGAAAAADLLLRCG
jgi:hypothetical protein